MRKHGRFFYQPVLPLGRNGKVATGCKAHRAIAAKAATEGTVLLKNDGTLPLQQGAKLCLFGRGAGDFLFGGGGSGSVYTTRLVTLDQGLQEAAQRGEIGYFADVAAFYKQEEEKVCAEAKARFPSDVDYKCWNRGRERHLPQLPESLYQQAKSYADTAIFCVSRFSSEGTDNGDRTGKQGDFLLWDEEQAMLDRLCKDFQKVVVVLNVCGAVSAATYRDNDRVGAVLYPMFSGSTAGEVITDMLLGKRYPSGHLQDTLAYTIEDYPSTDSFREADDHVDYTEDIFVGYRYFETFAPEKVAYPFGFGLSYTTFAVTKQSAVLDGLTVKLEATVKNTGNFLGKEVVQAYLTAPQGLLGKAKKVLCAFGKTKELKPGEETVVKLRFDLKEFGSFDDLGKIQKSAFLLEKGTYDVQVGTNVRDTESYLTFTLDADIICKQCHSYMAPRLLKERLTANGKMEALPAAEIVPHKPVGRRIKAAAPEATLPLDQAIQEGTLDAFIAGLKDEDIAQLLYGHSLMNASSTGGIGLAPDRDRNALRVPNVPTTDGPAGLRLPYDSDIRPTYFPCGTVMAQTWNLQLVQQAAAAGALEVKENNIGIWLSPGMNIHRNPMCGRNFEYYSEDPLCAGMFAGANVKGVQSQGIAATIKHFCVNNKERMRHLSDSRVSERALREIYLKGFEICVKKAKPWALMTSYNRVNGEQSSTNWEAVNGILRGEWKYTGIVMSDWGARSNLKDEIYAGCDVKMPHLYTRSWPGTVLDFDPVKELETGEFDRNACYAAVYRILKLMEHLD